MLRLVSLYDRASKSFGRPFVVTHLAQAVRGLTDEVNNTEQGSDLSRHPADFDLYHVGDFDESLGTVEAFNAPALIVRADTLVKES
ncbi:MAG: nonstructural protein [Microvirus sp.]|nr:MAG: nonstructural protein [Microvirus sp.]